MFGKRELQAFEKLPAFEPARAGFLCRQVLMKLLPAIHEKDFRSFSEAVTAIQMSLGNHFASVQGNHFSSPAVAAAIARLDKKKVIGYGQSSWGPTAFVFAKNEAHAGKIASLLKNEDALELSVEQINNRGSYVGNDTVPDTFT